jgi:hypothetical protein
MHNTQRYSQAGTRLHQPVPKTHTKPTAPLALNVLPIVRPAALGITNRVAGVMLGTTAQQEDLVKVKRQKCSIES